MCPRIFCAEARSNGAEMNGRPVRVVYFLDSLGVGGTEMNAVRVAERLDPARFTVSVACFNGTGQLRPRFDAAGIRVDVFPLRSLYGGSMLTEGRRFMTFLRAQRVDVVHAHDRYANMFAVAWARLAGTRAVIASKRWGNISRGHGMGNRLAYMLSHRVLANSERVGASLVAEDGVAAGRVVVVPNFVDDAAFDVPSGEWTREQRRELGVSDDALVVGIVANLREIKDHRTLFEAVALIASRFPTLVLVLIGSGPFRADLEARVAELGIEGMVRFAGPRPNLPNLHRLFDVSVLCSWSEGFPNSIVEAMAAQRPVVATSVGGIPDAVEHDHTGLLVPPRDAPALAAALERLLASRSLREEMGQRGLDRARLRFTAAVVLPRVTELYSELLGSTFNSD